MPRGGASHLSAVVVRTLLFSLVLLVPSCGPGLGLLPAPTPTPSGVLRVQVVERFISGVPFLYRTPPPTPTAYPVRISFRVQVVKAGAPSEVMTEGDTNASGMIEFRVPPGHYWVLVPKNDQPNVPPGYAGSLGNAPAPDRMVVYGWGDVTVPPHGEALARPTIIYVGA